MADSRILLAHSAQGAIFACQCGSVHVNVGDTMVSFSLEEFIALLELHPQAISGLETNIVAVRNLCQAGSARRNAITAVN